MRRFEKKENIEKANKLAEQRYLMEKNMMYELDYKSLYHEIDPWDKQEEKIDYYPSESKGTLDLWLQRVADTEKPGAEGRNARSTFLMNDEEFQKYKTQLNHIKTATQKYENGQALTDFEKKLVKFYKANKGGQKSRIVRGAKDKVLKNFIDQFNQSNQYDNIVGSKVPVISYGDKSENIMTITDKPIASLGGNDIKLIILGNINGKKAELMVFSDDFGIEADDKVQYGMRTTPEFIKQLQAKLSTALSKEDNLQVPSNGPNPINKPVTPTEVPSDVPPIDASDKLKQSKQQFR